MSAWEKECWIRASIRFTQLSVIQKFIRSTGHQTFLSNLRGVQTGPRTLVALKNLLARRGGIEARRRGQRSLMQCL